MSIVYGATTFLHESWYTIRSSTNYIYSFFDVFWPLGLNWMRCGHWAGNSKVSYIRVHKDIGSSRCTLLLTEGGYHRVLCGYFNFHILVCKGIERILNIGYLACHGIKYINKMSKGLEIYSGACASLKWGYQYGYWRIWYHPRQIFNNHTHTLIDTQVGPIYPLNIGIILPLFSHPFLWRVM